MPFDATLPANNSLVSSAELRGQFTSLKALIDAIPAGPQGDAGPVGGFVLRYTYDSSHVNPGGALAAGKIRSGDPIPINSFDWWVSETDRHGVDVSVILSKIKQSDFVLIFAESDPARFFLYEADAQTDDGNCRNLLVLSGLGGNGTFSNGEGICISFQSIGATGATGQGLNYRGGFDNGAVYVPYDLATYNGSTYICVVQTPSTPANPPDVDTTTWALFASKGDPGP
jgi:hypothetical protein